MKIIHCADLHLDSKMTANLTKEQAKERNIEILRTFTRMVDYGHENEVKAIIIAGDMFDTHNVSATVRNIVRDTIINNSNIDFFYLKGNHDTDSFLAKLETIPENLKLFGDSWNTYSYGKVAVTGLELTRENQATAYNSLVLDHDVYNIVTLHGQIAGYYSKNNAEIISIDKLKNKNIDYMALGHIHEYKAEQFDGRGIYCYPGCLEGRGFDECGQKGFVMLDIDEESLTAQCSFIPIACRCLYTVPVDVRGIMTTQEAIDRIEQVIAKESYPSGSLIKFVLQGEVDVECEINVDYIQETFADYFYFEKVCDETKVLVKYSDYEKDISLKGEFIRMVLNSDLDEEQKSEIIRCGIQALSGEEI